MPDTDKPGPQLPFSQSGVSKEVVPPDDPEYQKLEAPPHERQSEPPQPEEPVFTPDNQPEP